MSKFPSVKPKELVRFFLSKGFYFDRQNGTSHAIYKHEDGRIAIIPIHKGVDSIKGTTISTLKRNGFTPQDFLDWKNKK